MAWALLRRTTWSGDFRVVMPEISAETRAALSLDDRDPWAHFVQGNLFFRMRRGGDAVRSLRRALELNPNFALAHAFLGSSLALQGTHQEAVDSAEHALRLKSARPVCGHLCLDDDGQRPFHRRALSGMRHLGAQHNREKSGMDPWALRF